jgi:hypothetical protein
MYIVHICPFKFIGKIPVGQWFPNDISGNIRIRKKNSAYHHKVENYSLANQSRPIYESIYVFKLI